MKVSDFDFELPEERIALRPAEPRDAARLLRVPVEGALEDRIVRDLPELLRPGDVVVVNDTRVIAARLSGVRIREESVVRVEATLHRRLSPSRWTAFMKPGKRLNPGDRVRFGERADRACLLGALDATVKEKGEGGEITLAFDFSGPDLDMAIAERGVMPLPPYIAAKRAEDERDLADYQTMFAEPEGSVAAPTAGLHFTPELTGRLKARGIGLQRVTLHVGAGTFLPMKVDEIAEHRMHAEYGEVTQAAAEALNAARAAGGRIVCVGTTSLRLLESAAGRRAAWRGRSRAPRSCPNAPRPPPGRRWRSRRSRSRSSARPIPCAGARRSSLAECRTGSGRRAGRTPPCSVRPSGRTAPWPRAPAALPPAS